MLTTRQIFNYTLHTGRDIFDDFTELDRQEALAQLKQPNTVGLCISVILESLDKIGLTDVDLQEVLQPTTEPEEPEDKNENKDFIPNPENDLYNRAMYKAPKKLVSQTISAFMLTKQLNTNILLDAPYDIAVLEFNKAAKIKEDSMKRR